MMRRDMCDDLAALVVPPEAHPGERMHVQDRRERFANYLRHAWDEDDVDPLLTEIERVRRERDALDSQLRQLVAYGREFTAGPRPAYSLQMLARAAGLRSHSGVKTFYDHDTVDLVAARTGAVPRRRAAKTAEPPRHIYEDQEQWHEDLFDPLIDPVFDRRYR